MRSEKQYRVAIIGAGTIVQIGHIPNFQRLPNASVRALCDVNLDRAQTIAQEAGIVHVYSDYQKMLDEIQPDITVVAVPNIFHKEMAIAALDAGSHVLCEKPLALTYADAKEMMDKATSKGLTLNVGTHFRWTDPVQACKKHVDAGFFGEVYAARTLWHRRAGIPGFGSWFTNADLAGAGCLLDIGVHALDRALYLMGFPKPVSVMGVTFTKFGNRGMGLGGWGSDIFKPTGNERFDVDDLSWAFIRFDNGAVIQLQVAWAINGPDVFETELFGTDGGATVGSSDELELYTTMNGHHTDTQVSVPRNQQNSYALLVEHFVRHLDGDSSAEIITPEQALTSVRIIEAIQQSAESGNEVKLVD